jgi:hypothetical protein
MEKTGIPPEIQGAGAAVCKQSAVTKGAWWPLWALVRDARNRPGSHKTCKVLEDATNSLTSLEVTYLTLRFLDG